MDRNEIAVKARVLKSKEDLLDLLNYIRKAMSDDWNTEAKFYSFTMKHINFYCNPNHTHHRYKQFKIKKKTPGEYRLITAPRSRNFKRLLACVNELFKSLYTPSAYAMGFTEGKSIISNAEVHVNQNYVLNLDLKDFFPSISQARVWGRLQVAPFNFSQEIASLLAGLCAMKETHKSESGELYNSYVLPQGAPTSPIITNMVCDKLDRRLAGLAKRFGLHYTRYADDITFSSMHNVYKKDGKFFTELERIIHDQGFTINEKKTRLQKRTERQEVTGITVNQKLNVTWKYVRDLRNLLYIWDRYGYNVATGKFLPKYKVDKGHVKKGNPNMENVIDGKLLYLKMVKGEGDCVYQRLNAKYQRLVASMHNVSNMTKQGVTYIETLSMKDLMEIYNTEVQIKWSEGKKDEKGELKQSHRYALFNLNGESIKASVKKDVEKKHENEPDKLSISLCMDVNGKKFWLIHKKSFDPIEHKTPVDVDELNNDLDKLLNDIE